MNEREPCVFTLASSVLSELQRHTRAGMKSRSDIPIPFSDDFARYREPPGTSGHPDYLCNDSQEETFYDGLRDAAFYCRPLHFLEALVRDLM